jgi:DNA polymerase III psi subunit
MKYNYLERYNLIQIIQELQTATGLTKTNIKKYLSNFEKINIESFDRDKLKSLKEQVLNFNDFLQNKKPLIKDKKSKEFVSKFIEFVKDNFVLLGTGGWEVVSLFEELIQKIEQINSFSETKTSIDRLLNNLNEFLIYLKNNENKINENFNILKTGKGFFTLSNLNDTLYYFFFEEKLYCVKLFKFKNNRNNTIESSFSFYVSERFFNSDLNFFIANYRNFNYFDLKAKKLNDSKAFWLKIGAIIKSYSDEYKIKYFQFSGADDYDTAKPSLDSVKYATKNSFQSCIVYLKANLLKTDNSKNINISALKIINNYINKTLDLFDKGASWINLEYNTIDLSIKDINISFLNLKNVVEKSFEDKCKDLNFNLKRNKKEEIEVLKNQYIINQKKLLDKLEALNFFKKEINIFNTFLKNLNELHTLLADNNITKQKLIELYKILNKINIQNSIFQKAYQTIENNISDINEDYNKLVENISNNNQELIKTFNAEAQEILEYDFKIKIQELNYKVLNLISLYIYKNQIIREIRKNKNSKNILSTKDIIKRFEMLLNDIIKKYKLNRDIINQLIEIKNSFIPQFDDIKSYKLVTKKDFSKILTQTLEQVSKIENTFVLHSDYENRLKIYLKSINDNVFKNVKNLLSFIEELNFDPQYSYLDFKKINEKENKAGWLLSFTEEGMLSLFNAREKRYYNILINDLKIAKENITFENDNIVFKI